MAATRVRAVLLLATTLLVAACGGSGGTAAAPLAIAGIEVLTQTPGPLSPFGTTAGGDRVGIDGTGFGSGSAVTFGGATAVVESAVPDRIVVVTPPGPKGFATIEIQNATGQPVTLPGVFRYIAPPTVASVTAVGGPTGGEARAPVAGGEIEVKGTEFRDGIEVLVAGAPVATTFVDDTTVRAQAPAHKGEANVDIGVRNVEGFAATLPLALFYTQEFSLVPETAFNEARAQHLFRRAAFGAPLPAVQQAAVDGVATTVSALTRFTNDPAVEQEAMLAYGTTPPPTEAIGARANKQWWIHLMLRNQHAFQERLAWFLHDHFATSERVFEDNFRWTMHYQIQLFRRFSVAATDTLANGMPGLGYDWKKLLVEVAKDRAMLYWLNGDVSTRNAPNENFARELWELFMLGEGNGYTEADIKEAARAFTGFFRYIPRATPEDDTIHDGYYGPRHDERSKTILGRSGFFGYDSISPFWVSVVNPITLDPSVEADPRDTDGGVIALTLAQRPVEASRHICRKLFEFFVYENPDDSVVDVLAAQLRAPGPNQWNLKPILDTMLKSEAMYSTRAMKSQVKSPVDYLIGFMRTTGIHLHDDPLTDTARVYNALVEIGQVPLEPPDVSGWPSGAAWAAAQPMLERTNVVAFAVKQLDDYATDITPLLPPGPPSPPALVDHLARTLDVQITGAARNEMINYVNSQWSNGQQVPFAYDPNNPEHVKMKTRGLVWMIAQYYAAHVR
ncbi:MAG TPA: DUF1800 family protein [Planctomycetota bacterium]|nr:DUF1800 family protein [Planctomycetota bacterium]